MTNHPNRGPKGPASNPAPETIRAAREAARMTQTEAALLVHASLRAWQQWEAGDRRMHPGLWSLFRIRSMRVEDAASAFVIWWGEQPLANDPVDEAAQAAWLAAYELMLQETQESASWWVVCQNDDDAHVYQHSRPDGIVLGPFETHEDLMDFTYNRPHGSDWIGYPECDVCRHD